MRIVSRTPRQRHTFCQSSTTTDCRPNFRWPRLPFCLSRTNGLWDRQRHQRYQKLKEPVRSPTRSVDMGNTPRCRRLTLSASSVCRLVTNMPCILGNQMMSAFWCSHAHGNCFQRLAPIFHL
ncbi:unnamed protein product [Ixodes hexagonus]